MQETPNASQVEAVLLHIINIFQIDAWILIVIIGVIIIIFAIFFRRRPNRGCLGEIAMEMWYCGEIDCEQGLSKVAEAVERCSWNVQLVKSGYDGTHYLRADSDSIHLDMDSGQCSPFLFSGSVDGGIEQARIFLSEFSLLLSQARIRHRIEVYQESNAPDLEIYLHYEWPMELGPATPE